MLGRSVRLICVPALLGLLLAVGFPLKSKTAGLFFPAAVSLEQASQKTTIPATPVTARLFQGSLPQSVKLALHVARRNHTATALTDGRVLIVGGDNQDGAVSEAELLDPKSSTLEVAAKSLTPRAKHAARLLANGKVLITGGSNQGGTLDSTELFDPSTKAFTAGPRLQRPRAGHSATMEWY